MASMLWTYGGGNGSTNAESRDERASSSKVHILELHYLVVVWWSALLRLLILSFVCFSVYNRSSRSLSIILKECHIPAVHL